MLQTDSTVEQLHGFAWLEPAREDSIGAPRFWLTEATTTVGRVEAADMTVHSNRVSREHAVIERRANGHVLRDLSSTNGTFVNGVQIQEIILQDGDIVVFADVEFTFHTAESARGEAAVTQPMRTTEAFCDEASARSSLFMAMRRLHEAVALAGTRATRCAVHKIDTGAVTGFEIQFRATHALGRWECDLPGRPADRLRRLQLLAAAEASRGLPPGTTLFLPIRPVAGRLTALCKEMDRFQELIASRGEIVLQVDKDVLEDPPRRHACEQLCGAAGLCLAVDGFHGGRAEVLELADFPPAYVKFERAMYSGMPSGSDRARQLRLVAEACQELGSTVIVKGLQSADEIQVCQEAGCTLGQGPYFASLPATKEMTRVND